MKVVLEVKMLLLKAASIVKYSGLASICYLERVFLVSVYALEFVKLLKLFCFINVVTNVGNFTSKTYIL